jgi:hypothetical protein
MALSLWRPDLRDQTSAAGALAGLLIPAVVATTVCLDRNNPGRNNPGLVGLPAQGRSLLPPVTQPDLCASPPMTINSMHQKKSAAMVASSLRTVKST